MDGYIKVPKVILDWEDFTDGNCVKVLLYLMATAKFKDGEFDGHQLKRGDVIYSYKGIAEACGLSMKEARTVIGKLKRASILASKGTNKYSVGSLENWASPDYEPFSGASRGANKTATYKNNNKNNKEKAGFTEADRYYYDEDGIKKPLW